MASQQMARSRRRRLGGLDLNDLYGCLRVAEGSSEDSNGGDADSQSESSNRATPGSQVRVSWKCFLQMPKVALRSPGTGRKKEALEEGVLPGGLLNLNWLNHWLVHARCSKV